MSANSTSYSSVVLHNICGEISQTKTQNEYEYVQTQNKLKQSYAQNMLEREGFAIWIRGHFSNGSQFYTLTCECDDPPKPFPASSISQIPTSLSFQVKKEEWCPLIIWSGLWDGFRRMDGRAEAGGRNKVARRLMQKNGSRSPRLTKKKEEKNCETKGGLWLD